MRNPFDTLTTAFRALSSRNYRLYFIGQAVSQVGTWLQLTALSWLVYRLSHSAFLLGLTGFCGGIPSLVLPPLAGVAADRWPRYRMIKLIQLLFMLQAAVLAVLVLTGSIRIWQVLALSAVSGVLQAFDIPIRQSFVVEMIDEKNGLGNAIALNSLLMNAARLVGPSLAGVFITVLGEGGCFSINAASFLAILISLEAMHLSVPCPAMRRAGAWQDFREGFRYVRTQVPIRSVLLLVAMVGLLGSFQILMPVFAKDVLAGGAHSLGFLMSALGLGSLVAAGYLAARKTHRGLGPVMLLAVALFGAGLLGFAYSRFFWLSWASLTVAGFGMLVPMTGGNTLLQHLADDDKRGRVLSFFTIAYAGTAPFGHLLVGSLAHVLGAPRTVFLAGLAALATAAYAAVRLPQLREMARPIYAKRAVAAENAAAARSC